MKDERWILEKIDKNSPLDVFFPAGFTSAELPEWCNPKAFSKLGIALLEPGRSMLGLELRAPLILSLSRHQKTSLAVVVLSFCRVASPESFKPWHSLIIEVVSDIPYDALDLISRLLACDMQFRRTFFTKSGSSAVARSLATSFAVQSPDKFVSTIKEMLSSQYLTALKLLCSLLQRPEGTLAQVCCDFDICSKIIESAKEADGDDMYHSIAFLSMALAPMKALANRFILDVFVIIERAINGYYFQAPPSSSPPQDAWQRCIVLFLRSTFGLFPHHFVEHFRGRCAQDLVFGKRLKLLAGLVPIHFGLLCDMREELNDLKWQDCDPQSWSLWWVSAPSVPLEDCSFQLSSAGLQPVSDVVSTPLDSFKGQQAPTSLLSDSTWWDRYLYVCCAAELKRCEAKVLALQCSVDDLNGVHAINSKLAQRVSGYEQKLQEVMSCSVFNRGSRSDEGNFVHQTAHLHSKVNSLMKDNAALLTQLGSTQASLKISEDSRIRAERDLLDRTFNHHSHDLSDDLVSAAMTHGQFFCNASRFLAEADESSHNVSFNSLMHRCCSELSFKVKQLEEELRQERELVSSLRSERLSFLANIDNMNSMLDVARKLSRDRQGVLEQRWVAASRLNTLLEKRMMEQGQI